MNETALSILRSSLADVAENIAYRTQEVERIKDHLAKAEAALERARETEADLKKVLDPHKLIAVNKIAEAAKTLSS
jgi:hypothetical protein